MDVLKKKSNPYMKLSFSSNVFLTPSIAVPYSRCRDRMSAGTASPHFLPCVAYILDSTSTATYQLKNKETVIREKSNDKL